MIEKSITFIKKHLNFFSVLILILISFSLYAPIMNNKFVNLDDSVLVFDENKEHGLSFELIKTFFLESTYQLYHPIVNISYEIDYILGGNRVSNYITHTVNLIHHLIIVSLVFILFFLISKNTKTAFFVALCFALYPTNVEAVAWASSRKELVYTLFYILALILYVVYTRKEKHRLIYYSIFFFVLALAMYSKPMAITLPLILIVYDYAFLDKINIKDKIPTLLLMILFVAITLIARGVTFEELLIGFLAESNTGSSFLTGMYQYSFYIVRFFFPGKLAFIYSEGLEFSGYYAKAVYFVIPLMALSLIYTFFKNKKIFFGLMFYSISILPVLQIVKFGLGIVGDRYTYMPYLGFFYVFVIIFSDILKKNKNKIIEKVIIIFIIAMLTGGYLHTAQRVSLWNDSKNLVKDSVEKYPDNNPMGYSLLSGEYLSQGLFEEALVIADKMLKDNLYDARSHFSAAVAHFELKNYDKALEHLNRGVRYELDPQKRYEFYIMKGEIFLNKRSARGAIEMADTAKYLFPRKEAAYFLRAWALAALGRYDLAIDELNTLLKFKPNNVKAYNIKQLFIKRHRQVSRETKK